jgi:8-oxo-dGTP pyrophosphatase MutT (NUDIX family)
MNEKATRTYKRVFGEDRSHLKMYELSNGYLFASRKTLPVVAGNDKVDAVAVIARDYNGRLLIIREFRPAIGDYLWAFPAGLVDSGETPFQAAGREVKEETGLTLMVDPNQFIYYTNTYACPGMSDEKVAIIEGTVYGELSKEFQEKNENITPYLLSVDDMQAAGLFDPETNLQSWLAFYLMA